MQLGVLELEAELEAVLAAREQKIVVEFEIAFVNLHGLGGSAAAGEGSGDLE